VQHGKGPLGMSYLIPSPPGNYEACRNFSVRCRGLLINPPVPPNIRESKRGLSPCLCVTMPVKFLHVFGP
jgi:hypothetical protein